MWPARRRPFQSSADSIDMTAVVSDSAGPLVILRRLLLQFRMRVEVVLDPELRAGAREELLDRLSRRARLLFVELERRQPVQRALLRIVIQVARQHHAAGLRELHEEHLMAGRMSRRALEDRPCRRRTRRARRRSRCIVLLFFSAL